MPNDCLCHVRGFEIVYCPLHEAAPELLKAATVTLEWLDAEIAAQMSSCTATGYWCHLAAMPTPQELKTTAITLMTMRTVSYD